MMMIAMTQVAHSSESSVYTVAQPHEAQGVYTPDLTQVLSQLDLTQVNTSNLILTTQFDTGILTTHAQSDTSIVTTRAQSDSSLHPFCLVLGGGLQLPTK